MNHKEPILIVGAGIFGITAAIELQKRGWPLIVIDPGPVPNPLAASTDISKVIRVEYGSDEQYMEMMESAVEGWRIWNGRWPEPLFHETGVAMFTRQPMKPGGFEYESWKLMEERGHKAERINAQLIHSRFPAWEKGIYVDGYYHSIGGYAESGRVVAQLVKEAVEGGVDLRASTELGSFLIENGRCTGIITTNNETIRASHTIVAAGAWSSYLLPELQPYIYATGHPVFHLKTNEPELFSPPEFPVFTADIAETGWYGFPVHPREGVIKIANHGPGIKIDPRKDQRIVTAEDTALLRTFLQETFPSLTDAPIVYTRRCLYSDSLDGHFWIDQHPNISQLTVATGGSGHGFKFAPILGSLIADAVEKKENSWLPKFRWRTLSTNTISEEAARYKL